MSKLAFVDNNTGIISSVIYPNPNMTHVDGDVVEHYTVRTLPEGDISRILRTHYWHNGAWQDDMTPPPSSYHRWANGQWNISTEDLWTDIRNRRASLLGATDWTQLADAPLTDTKKAEWATYRQALRDVPANNPDVTSVDAVNWPTQPA